MVIPTRPKILTLGVWLGSRMIIVYAATAMACLLLTDNYRMKVKTINHMVPQNMGELVEFSFHPDDQHAHMLNKYLRYYRTVVKILPNSVADHAMLGYCHYYLGNPAKAITHYQKAVLALRQHKELKVPEFFWHHYNLGVIYYNLGDFDQAVRELNEAAASSPQATLYFIHVSKGYYALSRLAEPLNYNIEGGLLEGYRNVQRLLLLCQYRSKPQDGRKFHPRIF